MALIYRNLDGIVRPMTVPHGWTSSAPLTKRTTWFSFHDPYEDVCWKTPCPRCQRPVYFIRHNGGSVWVDDLGGLWPKHGCFDPHGSDETLEVLRTLRPDGPDSSVGVVKRVASVGGRGSGHSILAIEFLNGRRICIQVCGDQRQLAGHLIHLDVHKKVGTLTTGTGKTIDVFDVKAEPSKLGLRRSWLRFSHLTRVRNRAVR